MKFKIDHTNSEHSDEKLLELHAQTGEMKYFHDLYKRYIPLIYGLALKYLKNTNDAQDVVINIYEHLHDKITRYTIDKFDNWLYSVVKHHCFQELRDRKKEILVDFDSTVMESDNIINLFDEETDDEREKAVKECIKELPEPQHITIIKFFYEEKSYADIVEETSYNMKSVKSYLQNGRRNLRICIENKLKL